jgi:hypothetical protein
LLPGGALRTFLLAGLFGLLLPRHWLGDVVAGLLSATIGYAGYIAALKYFDPLVMAAVMLCDQIIGNFLLRITFQEAPWPRRMTLAAALPTAAAGIVAMVLASRAHITHFNIRLRQNP